tara:strand:- start:3788 stop:4981 length:1194 start_codon:yes stop_codon:yes gene_type:complete
MAQQQMSLFGPSAFDIQRQQAQQDRTNAVAQAQLTPFQSIRADALMAGTRAGRSLAGLFGIEDPALSEAKKMEELKAAVASQWDGNDPLEAYKIFAKEASARGLTQAAIGAATQVKAFEADREKTALGKREAEARIGLTETQTKSVEGIEKRAVTKFTWDEQDRPLQQAIKNLEFTKNVQDINLRNAQLTEAQIKLESAQAEWNALTPEEREKQAKSKAKLSMDKLQLEIDKLKADIRASDALTSQRSRETSQQALNVGYEKDLEGKITKAVVTLKDGSVKEIAIGEAKKLEESGVPASNRNQTGKLPEEEQRNLIRSLIAGGGAKPQTTQSSAPLSERAQATQDRQAEAANNDATIQGLLRKRRDAERRGDIGEANRILENANKLAYQRYNVRPFQ